MRIHSILRTFFFFFVLMTAGASTVSAGIDLVGASTYMMPDGGSPPQGKLSYPGAGVILNYRVLPKINFSVGAVYLSRSYSSGGDQIQKVLNGRVGFGLRVFKGLTFNLGAYYNHFMENPSQSSGKDYGGLAGIAIRFPIFMALSFLIQPEYHYALKPIDFGSGSFKPSEVVGLVGFTLGR